MSGCQSYSSWTPGRFNLVPRCCIIVYLCRVSSELASSLLPHLCVPVCIILILDLVLHSGLVSYIYNNNDNNIKGDTYTKPTEDVVRGRVSTRAASPISPETECRAHRAARRLILDWPRAEIHCPSTTSEVGCIFCHTHSLHVACQF